METKVVHGGAGEAPRRLRKPATEELPSQTATIVEQYTSLLREISRRHAKE